MSRLITSIFLKIGRIIVTFKRECELKKRVSILETKKTSKRGHRPTCYRSHGYSSFCQGDDSDVPVNSKHLISFFFFPSTSEHQVPFFLKPVFQDSLFTLEIAYMLAG